MTSRHSQGSIHSVRAMRPQGLPPLWGSMALPVPLSVGLRQCAAVPSCGLRSFESVNHDDYAMRLADLIDSLGRASAFASP